jgi:hypothetical protein
MALRRRSPQASLDLPGPFWGSSRARGQQLTWAGTHLGTTHASRRGLVCHSAVAAPQLHWYHYITRKPRLRCLHVVLVSPTPPHDPQQRSSPCHLTCSTGHLVPAADLGPYSSPGPTEGLPGSVAEQPLALGPHSLAAGPASVRDTSGAMLA